MEAFCLVLLGVLITLATVLELGSHASDKARLQADMQPGFRSFRNNYLVVNSLMMAGDWLQGPYIYALYEHYGYQVGDIGRLFIAGFGSSMIFGTIAGALADQHGRRRACIMYAATYSLSCLTKHSPKYWVLMGGRILGGVSTSLLFSTFESWLVAEHTTRGFAAPLLGTIFSKSVFLGGGLMAILSGLVGNMLVEDLHLGPASPFDAAIVVMSVGACIIMASWPENFGSSQARGSLLTQFIAASHAIANDRKIALLGAMQALFEGSMYTWVFLWTPALSPAGEKVPHGLVFSCFMTACMVGSALTGIMMRRMPVEGFMVWVYVLSAMSMVVPLVYHQEMRDDNAGSSLGESSKGGLSLEGKTQLLAFCVFEGCIGVFWPTMMTLRARFVPEDMRSTIINIFRIPLNLFVCIILYEVSKFPLSFMFGLCACFLFVCVACQMYLMKLIHSDNHAHHPKSQDMEAAELLHRSTQPEPHAWQRDSSNGALNAGIQGKG